MAESKPIADHLETSGGDNGSLFEKHAPHGVLELDGTAVHAPNAPRGYAPKSDEEKRLDKKINLKLDLLIVPILAFNFLLCGIDKSNIGNAATTTFAKDANLGPNDVSNAVSLLSVTFVILQPFSVSVGRRVGPRNWLPVMMFCWAACTMAHAAIKNNATLIALRLLLGAFEAGYFPTTIYYLSTMYPRYNLGFRVGLFSAQYAFAGAFSGVFAYGCFLIKGSLKGWQYLFLIEGSITVASAIFTYFWLPSAVHTAWFLTPEERAHSEHRMLADTALFLEEGDAQSHGITKRDVIEALDWKKLLIVLGNILATLPVSAFGVFAPLIVKGMGYTSLKANLMTVPPFAVAAVGLSAFVYSSDRFRERSLHSAAGMVLAIVGLAVMRSSSNNQLRYGFLHVCLAGAFVAGPLLVAWLAGNTPAPGSRAVIIGINGYSNIAGVIAGQLFKAQYAPSYKYPLTVTMILIVVGIVILLSMRLVLMRLNSQRRKKLATMSPAEIEAERLSNERRGDRKTTFIYGL
ncbi:MFS general substrate transporter [Pseudohyphozyma bogoriensis]|nr:MFS general substrate transporter [Pseudohyphozyma bogoriensis]